MCKGKGVGMQTLALDTICIIYLFLLFIPIECIPGHGQSGMGHMHTYLVCAARFRPHLKVGQVGKFFQD